MKVRNMKLFVCGILMIIMGIGGLLMGLIAVFGADMLSTIVAQMPERFEATQSSPGVFDKAALIAFGIFSLVKGAVFLIAGILGVKNAARPVKATICIIFGIIAALVYLFEIAMTLLGGGAVNPITTVIEHLIPVLYLIGALENKRSSRMILEQMHSSDQY